MSSSSDSKTRFQNCDRSNISNLLTQHGDGVYTIVLWAEINGEYVPISEYSIFIPPRQ